MPAHRIDPENRASKVATIVRVASVLTLCLMMACSTYAQENNSFADRQVYNTDAFRFEVPPPWFYAIPDATKKKNLARCFLHSRLQLLAQGVLLVDAGRPVGSHDETLAAMIKVMKGTNEAVEIQRENVALDGDKAVHLKSDVANYALPCSVIIIDHKEIRYLIMMSVSKKSDMENRELMMKTLLQTWKWKESTTSTMKQ